MIIIELFEDFAKVLVNGKEFDIAITHLALGIPIGADFDYIDHETMSAAIISRKKID